MPQRGQYYVTRAAACVVLTYALVRALAAALAVLPDVGHRLRLVVTTTPPQQQHTFALFGDTHLWVDSIDRRRREDRVVSLPVRDGLLVNESLAVVSQLLAEVSEFAHAGGTFGVHLGDAVCGGSNFGQSTRDYEASLREYRRLEVAHLGDWPVLHVPGNHDIDSVRGGTVRWRSTMCANSSGIGRLQCAAAGKAPVNYVSITLGSWRVLVLDAQDGLSRDTDGHGLISSTQLRWLHAQLEDSASKGERVALIAHQLLAMPSSGGGWIIPRQDFIKNRRQVMSMLASYSHVKLSLHGHVHANTVAKEAGIYFVTSASASEYPMHWHEVTLGECAVAIKTHALKLNRLRMLSRGRDTRRWRNEIKMGFGRNHKENVLKLNVC